MTDILSGEDIQKILHSTGPVVKCVLLRAVPADDTDDYDTDTKQPAKDDSKKPAVKDSKENDDKPSDDRKDSKGPEKEEEKVVLKHLINEIEVDTTPRKSQVSQVLGGPITFLGQYEDEDLVVVCRRAESMDSSTPWNPHKLQPPFDDAQVQGDILIMKLAPEEEEKANGDEPTKSVSTDDEFFLDFTKDEYIAFALRDDVEPPEMEKQVEDEEEEEIEEDGDDEEFVGEDDDEEGDDDAEPQVAMMNLIMGQVLRRFHEENGRGPDTRELLELRSALAQKLGVQVPEIVGEDWDDAESDDKPSTTGKRTGDNDNEKGEEDNASDEHEAKRVKFSQEETSGEQEKKEKAET